MKAWKAALLRLSQRLLVRAIGVRGESSTAYRIARATYIIRMFYRQVESVLRAVAVAHIRGTFVLF